MAAKDASFDDAEFDEAYDEEELYEFQEEKGMAAFFQRWGPCFMGALAVEFLVFGAMAMVEWSATPVVRESEIIISPAPPEPEPPEEQPEPDIQKQLREFEHEEQIVDPVITKDVEVADHNETADDEPFEQAKGDPSNLAQVDFKLKDVSDIMGVGGGGGGRFGNRFGGKQNLVRGFGGSRRTEDAVVSALEWLRRHQSSDGRWDIDGFMSQCDRGKCSGPGTSHYDVGVTGLALEAFLGHGETHQTGRFKATVEKALNFLRRSQLADGTFGEKVEHYMYNHALATYAMAEAYAMTEDPTLKAPVQRAVDFLVQAQNPGMAWRYRNYNSEPGPEDEGGRNDTSVTGWVIMALKAAKVGGINVPDSAFAGANKFLSSVQSDKEYQTTFGYYGPEKFVFKQPYVTTAAGVLTRQFTGRSEGVPGGVAVLMDHIPQWDRLNMYEWYYSTLVIFQDGGENWKKWNEQMKRVLLEHQWRGKQHCEEGSWDPEGDTWGKNGGRVYTTASGALCLEVYYRYTPLIQGK